MVGQFYLTFTADVVVSVAVVSIAVTYYSLALWERNS